MKKIKKLLSLLCIFLLMINTVSCGSQKGKNGDTDANKAENLSADSNMLKVQLASGVDTLDSQKAVYDTSFEVIANINEGLMRVGSDGNVANGVAESYEVSSDGLKYTFHLRDASWSNGEEVKAGDFVYGWIRAIDPNTASEYAYLVGDYILNADDFNKGKCSAKDVGVKAIDSKTLEVTLKSQCPFFLSLLYLPVYAPLNQAFFEKSGDLYATSPEYILSNGPFVINSYSVNANKFDMKKNDKYWNADSVSLGGIAYQVIKDNQQAMFAYKNNDIDIATVTGDQLEVYGDSDEIQKVDTSILWYMSPNVSKSKELSNLNLRKALALSYNKEDITKNILKDDSFSANYVVPEGVAKGPDGKDFRQTQQSFKDTDKQLAADYWGKAKTELGISSLELTLVYDAEENPIKIATFIKEQLEKNLNGLTIKLQQMPRESRVDAMMKGDYDLGITRWGADYSDPTTYLDIYKSDNPSNYGKWTNNKFDSLMEESRAYDGSSEAAKRFELLQQAERCIMDDYAIFPLYQERNCQLVKSKVKNIEFHTVAYNRIFINASLN